MLRLRDDQWERIREHCPEEHIPDSRPGRKPVPARAILEVVLWIVNTGAQWYLLPPCDPNYTTVHRRFQQWCEREVLCDMLTQLANTLREEGAIDERESSLMRRLRPPRAAATPWDSQSAAQASRSWRLWIAMGCRSR
jgi:transposase